MQLNVFLHLYLIKINFKSSITYIDLM